MFYNQEYYQSVINDLTDNEKKRLRKAQEQQTHEFFYFDVSTFNVGSVVRIRQTNVFKSKLVEDGYSFYLKQSELYMYDLN